MKKQWKRFKKKLANKWDCFKEHVKAQKFYLNQCRTAIQSFFAAAIICSFIMVAAFSANLFHDQYIESYVGSQVVFITSPADAKLHGMATGFEVKAPSGKIYTLTNAHVCALQSNGVVMVATERSGRLVPKRVLEVWDQNDLCLVEGFPGYKGLSLASDTWVSEKGWAVGFPLGQSLNISSGRIKDFSDIEVGDPEDKECKGPRKHIEHIDAFFFIIDICVDTRFAANTDIQIYPGNSGSPMVNMFGNVIGVIFAGNNQTNWGSAVPLEDVSKFLQPW